MTNVVWNAEQRRRITSSQGDEILQAMQDLEIEIITPGWGMILPLARQFDRSAYDATYLSLALEMGEPLVTGDLRLYNAMHEHLDWVIWIGDYPVGANP